MYIITETNGTEHLSDTLYEVCLGAYGCYVMPKDRPVEGFCGKIPVEVTPEPGEGENPEAGEPTIQYVDTVFVLPGMTMKGTEPEATWREIPAVPEILELDAALTEAYEILYGEEEGEAEE